MTRRTTDKHARDNRARQRNPNHPRYWKDRGHDDRPTDWKDRITSRVRNSDSR